MAMIHLEPQTLEMFSRALDGLKPPPNLSLSQWADKYRKLSAEASASQGQWNTDAAPFQREIMDAIGDVHIRKVVAMMCAQAGKTEGLILNTIGFLHELPPGINHGDAAHGESGRVLLERPPDPDAARYAGTPGSGEHQEQILRQHHLEKEFPRRNAGHRGSQCPHRLAQPPHQSAAGRRGGRLQGQRGQRGRPGHAGRGTPDDLLGLQNGHGFHPDHKSRQPHSGRVSTTPRKKNGTVPCPNCGFYQPFVWDNMVFDKDKWPDGGVQYRCAECGCLDNEYRWKKGSVKGKWVPEHPERSVRGFHMNKMGSTLCGWDEIVTKFIAADLDAARGDYEKMQVFVNTNLGLPWEEPGETVESAALIDRREFYEAEVPDDVIYLTAGVDTQDNRFEIEVVGWGIGKESWGIRYQRIFGDLKRGQIWADLDEFLSQTWKKKDGTELSLRSVCMDSGGHFPDQVIRFCKEREDRHIWAIKGRGGMDVPYIRNPTKNNRVKGELFTLGVDTGKNHVLARLKVLIKGPNYCHFPAAEDAGYDENYFKMLTAEHKVTRWKGGRKVERWELKDPAQKRNEAFDVRNYATAALEISNPQGLEVPGEETARPAKQQHQYRRRRSGGI